MSDNLPAIIPSLARVFEAERTALRTEINDGDLNTTKSVAAARRALDRTGSRFVTSVEDVQTQKAGLWLIEMIKAGVTSLDRATSAEIIWREVPPTSPRVIAGSTLFYGVAAAFLAAGLLQGSSLTMMAALALAALRFFDPKDWKYFLRKIPFLGRKAPKAIAGPTGEEFTADAHIGVDAGAYIDSIVDALNTADHLLLRFSERESEQYWHDDPRLLGFIQSLLEAQSADDSEFAFKLIGSELESMLAQDGIETVAYSRKTAAYFDVLPALDMQGTKQAAPALKVDGEIVKRGTVWKSE